MLSSASTHTKHARQLASRPPHPRQRSPHANEVQDANAAGRPFQFVPKRRSSSGSGTGAGAKVSPTTRDHDEAPAMCCDSPKQMEVSLSEATAGDQPTPSQGSPRPLFTFPRARSDKAHCPLPEFSGETSGPDSPIPRLIPTPKSALHLDLDVGRRYAVPTAAFTQAVAPSSVAIAGMVPYPRPASAGPTAAFSTALVRKKSGELVKPSLKPPAPSAFTTWSAAGRVRTKSAPTTPVGPKFVHFDAQLEHVKLFLAEQKPLAVSRDGSPTETSEGETDTGYPFPSISLPLRLRIIALPLALPVQSVWTFDVRLEKAMLEDATLVGHVIVRNVAFAKWVAVRFTLDAWQTTSEVAARHVASLRDGFFDRFEFRVRLGDYLSGIEAKRLIWCVRYSVEGREMWDSNGGRNYEVGFERVKEEPQRKNVSAAPVTGPTTQARRTGLESMADLRKQLEKVVQDGQDADGPPPPLATALHRKKPRSPRMWIGNRDLDDDDPSPPRSRSLSPSPLGRNDKDKEGEAATPSLRDADAPLSARYDFDISLKSSMWTPPPPSQRSITPTTPKPKRTGMRARSPPALPNSVSAVQPSGAGDHRRSMSIPVDAGFTFRPVVPLPRGSPRDSADFADERGEEHHRLSRGQDAPRTDVPARHHARAWAHGSSYADRFTEEAPPLLQTPPSTPTVTAPTPTPHGLGFRLIPTNTDSSSSEFSCSPSVSPSGSSLALDAVWGALRAHDAESIASTPSITTSSSSPSLSPLSPHGHFPRATSDESLEVAAITGMSRAKRPPVDSTPYHSFVDQFCFFTGVNTHSHTYAYSDGFHPRRAHSASSVEDYFTLSTPPNDGALSSYATIKGFSSGHTTPTCPPITTEFMSNRGLATPRPGTPNEFPPSALSTPVAG